VSPSPPPPSDHLLHSLAHLLMSFVRPSLQQIEHDIVTWSASTPLPSPAASPRKHWMQSKTPTKPSSSPCPPASRPSVTVVQEP
jgi:hypothetical protein